MANAFISARWLIVGLFGLGLWLAPGFAYGQSRELLGAFNQARTLYGQGRYEEALPFYKKAVRLGKQEFGPNHPTLATLLNNLAVLYQAQSRYAEAEPLYKRALAIQEKALGPDHPDVANSLNNLAALYQEQGRYADAEPLYERALTIREKSLGPEHPDVAKSLNNLALL